MLFAVSLQPFDFDPNEKNKHKFMVLTTVAAEGEDPYNVVSIPFCCQFGSAIILE